MSDQYNPPSGPPPGHNSNNPYNQQGSNNPFQQQQQPQQTQQSYGSNQPQQYQGYDAPPGPPPQRVGTFDESKFIPESERGEQREAMEQFEMNKGGHEDSADRDVATLQSEFPNVDGSLIAAIYGDSKNMGATREMLGELAGGTQ